MSLTRNLRSTADRRQRTIVGSETAAKAISLTREFRQLYPREWEHISRRIAGCELEEIVAVLEFELAQNAKPDVTDESLMAEFFAASENDYDEIDATPMGGW